jgi:hypothetical protein
MQGEKAMLFLLPRGFSLGLAIKLSDFLCTMNGCDSYRSITDDTRPVTFSHSVIQHDHLSRLSSTTLCVTCLKLTSACQQK